jgi:hypothetical protein
MINNIFVLQVRALSSLDLSQNKLREAEAKVLAQGITKWCVCLYAFDIYSLFLFVLLQFFFAKKRAHAHTHHCKLCGHTLNCCTIAAQ